MDELGVGGRSGKTPRWFVVDWRADQAGGESTCGAYASTGIFISSNIALHAIDVEFCCPSLYI